MAKSNVFASLDIGTSKVCTVVGEISEDGETQILGMGLSPAKGIRRGMVVNIEEAMDSIRNSVEQAQRSSGFRILSAYVGIAGNHIASFNNRGVVAISHSDRLVTTDDVGRVLEAARTIDIPSNREILHILARDYALDGQDGIKNPVGLHGFRLDAETHIITGAVTPIQNLTKCVHGAGIEIEDLVVESLASSEAILSEEEKEIGVALADIGGSTTNIALFVNGSIWHTAVLQQGGYHITSDIAIGLHTSFAIAEEVKIQYGQALPSEIDPEESFEMSSFGAENKRIAKRRHLSEIIRARAEEILETILIEVKRSGNNTMLPAGLILTGGSANLKGLIPMATDLLQMPVRIGVPKGTFVLSDGLRNPAYATGIGLLLWGS
ncbi:MAG: cell division protein FtsA, partial [Chloroflexi bacterium]|nr:cell division protein FtsA [Chloroflexota bacterium]